MPAEHIEIAGHSISRGTRARFELPLTRTPFGSVVGVPVIVLHGRRPGPRVWLFAAVHGDELNGIEVVRRVVQGLRPRRMAGTLLAVPVVNVLGFQNRERTLPDRRDLNRSFPGSPRGSLASRLAHILMEHLVTGSDWGIDLHTGSNHRVNLPQVRAALGDAEILRMAQVFGAPLMLDAQHRSGSLREAAMGVGCRALLYEAGEALRLDRRAVEMGVDGVLRVLAELSMIEQGPAGASPSLIARSSAWVRARRGGLFLRAAALGQRVAVGDPLGELVDLSEKNPHVVRSRLSGVVIGHTDQPSVNRGDALVHVAEVELPVA